MRVLRHYHEIDLLTPESIDSTTGYRFYRYDQIEILRAIVALRQMGLALAEIAVIIHGELGDAEVRKILCARRSDAVAEARAVQATIERIDAHLGALEVENGLTRADQGGTVIEVDVKSVESRLVAQLSAVAESWAPPDIGPVIQPLYPELVARLATASIPIAGPSTAWYEDTDEGRVRVHATLTIGERPPLNPASLGFQIVELPALDKVASTIHHGSMDECDATYGALLVWIDEHHFRPLGYGREVDVRLGPDNEWASELQIAIEPVKETES